MRNGISPACVDMVSASISPAAACNSRSIGGETETGMSASFEIEYAKRRFAESRLDFDRLLTRWAREFVAGFLHGPYDIDARIVDSLARLLRLGADAAAWTIDDAPTTAAFLVYGSRRIIHRSLDSGCTVPTDMDSTIVGLCRRVVRSTDCPA